jgi:predicted regulator of Ras-like GTPase activity (Roadblock/LC7/MglB family)
MKDMILFPEDIDRLNLILEQLTVKANLLLAVLINKDGRLLTYQGSLEKIDTVSMAALVAGNSASTLAIANLMGETEFSTMYHQGKDRHIFISVVDENTFLCLVFDDRTNIDRVKVFARQFDRQIKTALKQVYDKTEDQVDLDLDMGAFNQPSNASPTQNFQNEQQQSFFSVSDQQPPSLIKPEPVSGPFPQAQPDQSKTAKNASPSQKPGGGEEEVFFTEAQAGDRINEDSHDTNYLYLKKKIRETVNRKKEQ